MSESKPLALVIAGPTASGKSALAIRLAQHFPVEIISIDSAQVFRDMDIGTAKPSADERAAVPHHLLDLISPEEAYSAARFRTDALRLIGEIHARGKTPLLVGGTMLYLKALREGLAELPSAEPELRAAIERDAAIRGWPALHSDLAQFDPITAARLAPNDKQRIQRALEVVRGTGKPLSAWHAEQQAQAELPFRLHGLALTAPDDAARKVLHKRIAQRFAAMLAAGLEDEVVSLRARYRLHAEMTSMRCVGYRQVWEVLDGTSPRAELLDRGIYATRQLAKRQLTWLRGMDWLTPIDFRSPTLADEAVRWASNAPD